MKCLDYTNPNHPVQIEISKFIPTKLLETDTDSAFCGTFIDINESKNDWLDGNDIWINTIKSIVRIDHNRFVIIYNDTYENGYFETLHEGFVYEANIE